MAIFWVLCTRTPISNSTIAKILSRYECPLAQLLKVIDIGVDQCMDKRQTAAITIAR